MSARLRRTGNGSLSRTDKWMLGGIAGVALVLILVVALLGPASDENDPRPTTDNAGPAGAKAALLTLQQMGVPAARWEKPLAQLADADPQHTTLILAEPVYLEEQQKDLAADVAAFLAHGGLVIATGDGGARLLGGRAVFAPLESEGPCKTIPEGPGELAAAGVVEFRSLEVWTTKGTQYRVEQRCGVAPVVVRFATAGGGQAIWWASPTPLTNAGLKDDANLRLFVASLGPDLGRGRRVYFDESLRSAEASMWDSARGLPLTWLKVQAVLVFLLLLFSFSRRRGPVRAPLMVPRSSPVEFAENMGDLYEKAGATMAAILAARHRLDRLLLREAGLQQATLAEGPRAIADALAARLGGDWSALAQHLEEAQTAGDRGLTSRSTLHIVRALYDDEQRLRRALKPAATRLAEEEEETAAMT